MALQFSIQKIGILLDFARGTRVANFNIVASFKAQRRHILPHNIFRAHQDRLAKAQILIGDGGPNDLFLFALGKNHPPRILPRFVHDDL